MILIALGANQSSFAGPPEVSFPVALDALAGAGDIVVAALSRLYRSPAWPDPALPEFRNAVARIETDLSAPALLARLHEIETRFGRVRAAVNASRPLDLDLLDYRGEILSGDELVLPHPRLHERAFVLLPLADVAPDWRHPVSRLDAATLIASLSQALLNGVEPV